MNDQLAKLGQQSQSLAPKEFFDDVTKRGDYISPLGLADKLSRYDENIGWKAGDFIFDQKKILGRNINVLPLGYRPHAMVLENDKVTKQTFKADELYKEIKEKNDAKVNGWISGIDFLVWLPSEQKFAILFLYRTKLKEAGQDLRSAQAENKFVTLNSHKAEWNNYTWYVPKVTNCTLTDLPMPSSEELEKAITMFNDIEKAMAAPAEGERPR